jgi:hypothetical protein
MSTHAFTIADERSIPDVMAGCILALRWPNATDYTGTTLTLTFTPDLSTSDASVLSEIVRAAVTPLTRSERNAIEPQLVTGRAFLALSQADFIALGQNARDRMLHDNVSAQWRVIFRLLRE